jgi:LuxR family maltose regulon positive regulatory protein
MPLGFGGGAPRDGVNGYPIQLGKVQRPPLRDETLARHRLLDWLEVKIHNRVVFVIADAGYGKTTLLADFSRRTRLRTLWYRMDQEDRNWVSFLSYLVAAGRQHDPGFAPRTSAMLQDTGPGGASRDDVLESLLRELPSLAPDGATLILDDFHVADDIADIRQIARELVIRGPERLTLVFSSRRTPTVPVARLRALGEVGELRTEDLRFSGTETEALFKETYGRPLEPDVLASLNARTEGWAASLYLVQAALRDRTPRETRAFVRNLSGAHAELYDYLAEEVVGDLTEEFQRFLMRTSVLQAVDPEQAEVATGLDRKAVQAHIAESERLGLIARRHERQRVGHAYHPLVREFLEARLRREVGDAGIDELHRSVARWAESNDWRASCFHYAAAGDAREVHRLLNVFIEDIVGSGDIPLASAYLDRFPPPDSTAPFEIIHSRRAANLAEVAPALVHARRAVDLDPTSDSALGNLLATYFLAGELRHAGDLAARLAASAKSSTLRQVGTASWHLLDVTLEGNLRAGLAAMTAVVEQSKRSGHTYYEGVGLLNRALMFKAQGAAEDALHDANEAFDLLSRTSSDDHILSAQLAKAWASAHLGRLNDARLILATATELCPSASRVELLLEAAQIEVWYGDESAAAALLSEAATHDTNPSLASLRELTHAQLALRVGNVDVARSHLPRSRPSVPTQETGHLSRHIAISAHIALLEGDPDALAELRKARAFAERQGAAFWARYADALLAASSAAIGRGIRSVALNAPVYLSLISEVLVTRLHELDNDALEIVITEARARPERWRDASRRIVGDDGSASRPFAARVLDMIGGPNDVSLLRAVARTLKGNREDATLGRGLARRLATAVYVDDLGRVEIYVGPAVVPGTELRRKVLAMLCYLLTRPRFAATRDEVVDALWPDMTPEVAVNSLNQTVYFLRRVFEPKYKEDLSAGYVRHDSDILWLDRDLVGSRSQRCKELLEATGSDASPDDAERLSELYSGRFALDFSYEEWAGPFRDALHVRYLQTIERAVTRDIETGNYDRGIRLARRALDIDPDLETLELSLLRLYRITGAHSAAAEQYAHYAAYLRDELGVEPPPLTSL